MPDHLLLVQKRFMRGTNRFGLAGNEALTEFAAAKQRLLEPTEERKIGFHS